MRPLSWLNSAQRTQLMWPERVCRNLPSGAPQIFTVLSSAAETSKVPSREKETDLMHPPCADLSALGSYSPTIEGVHIRMERSREPLAMVVPSDEYATAVTASVWPLNLYALAFGTPGLHIMSEWSSDAVTSLR